MGKVVDGYYEITDPREACLFLGVVTARRWRDYKLMDVEGQVNGYTLYRLNDSIECLLITPAQLWEVIKPVGRGMFYWSDEWARGASPDYDSGELADCIARISANAITLKRVGTLRELVAFCKETTVYDGPRGEQDG